MKACYFSFSESICYTNKNESRDSKKMLTIFFINRTICSAFGLTLNFGNTDFFLLLYRKFQDFLQTLHCSELVIKID